MEYKTVLLETEGEIAILTINRPKALNALSTEVLTEISHALDEVENNHKIHALIVTGAGDKAFIAGADIAEMSTKTAEEARAFSKVGNEVFLKLEHLRVPTIAAVNGFALGGGCELAMSTDIRIAASNAIFGQPEVGLGITPGFGGTQRLARIVGLGHAKELIYSASNIKADRALEIGLVNKVVEAGQAVDAAKELAGKILSKSPVAVEASKRAINGGIDKDIEHAVAYEEEIFGICFASEDQKEGMTAFLEKRKPSFKR